MNIIALQMVLGILIGFSAGIAVGLFCGRIIARNSKALKDAKLYKQYTDRFKH